jgi:hypothetical protein
MSKMGLTQVTLAGYARALERYYGLLTSDPIKVLSLAEVLPGLVDLGRAYFPRKIALTLVMKSG